MQPPVLVDTELELQQCWQHQQLLQCLFPVGALPVEMALQPLRQGLLIQQEPGELEHQLERLCQLPGQP